ncbi:hypothetical protein ACTFIU_010168 [Dictyostelium citrinum]
MLPFKILFLINLITISSGQFTFNVYNSAPGSKCENGTLAELNTCSKDCLTSFLILKSIDKKSFLFTTFNNNQCTGDFNTQTSFDCKPTPQNISETQYLISCEQQTSKPALSHSPILSNSTTKSTTTYSSNSHAIKSTNATPLEDTPHHSASSSSVVVRITSSLVISFISLIFLFGF